MGLLLSFGSSHAALRGGGSVHDAIRDQFPSDSPRVLEDGKPPCGLIAQPCVDGASCVSSPEGFDHCHCNEELGWVGNQKINDIPGVVEHKLWGYFSCVQRNECLNQDLNVCADIPNSCVDLPPGPTPGLHQYKCICPEFYVQDETFAVDPLLGPLKCLPVDFCQPANDSESPPCPEGQICVSHVGGFKCHCSGEVEEMLPSGECRSVLAGDNLLPGGSSDPAVCGSSSKPCNLPGQYCEGGTNMCLCKKEWFQPAGEGAACQQRNECELKLDSECDQTGRGTPNAVSECIEASIEQHPRGYKCRCLVASGFVAAPNTEDGTDCIPAPTPPPSTAPASPQPSRAPVVPTEAPESFCDRVNCGYGQFCSAENAKCLCASGFAEVESSPLECEMTESGKFDSSIASQAEVKTLLATCDPCSQTGSLTDYGFASISVSNDGKVALSDGDYIAAASGNYDLSSTGTVLMHEKTDSVTVSFENLQQDSTDRRRATVANGLYFQVVFYKNGDIELRWGSGTLPSDKTILAEIFVKGKHIPVIGKPFGSDGRTSAGDWPTNQSRRFKPISSNTSYCPVAVASRKRCSCHEDYLASADYSTSSCCQCGDNASCQSDSDGYLRCMCNSGFYGNGETGCVSVPQFGSNGAFVPLASFGTLLGGDLDQYNSIETVSLPFSFPWRKSTSYSDISIAANGVIWLGEDVFGSSSPDPIGGTGCRSRKKALPAPRIAAAQAYLDPQAAGSIFVALGTSVAVISWEGVAHYGGGATVNRLNFQAVLHADGKVDLYWGSGQPPSSETIVAGLEDGTNSVAVPATGGPFATGGQTNAGGWPTAMHRRFTPTSDGSYCEEGGESDSQRCSCHVDFLPTPNDLSTSPCCHSCGANASCQADSAGFSSCVCDTNYFRDGQTCVAFAPCGNFMSIASSPAASNLNLSCDYCVTNVNLPFKFPWIGSSVETIDVASDGDISLPGGSIYVAAGDLDSRLFGSVYASVLSNSAVISWEGVPHYYFGSLPADNGLNFQVELHDNGVVDLRWGSGNPPSDRTIHALLRQYCISDVPATGTPFVANTGTTTPGEWPTNDCRRFYPAVDGTYVEYNPP